MHYGFFLFFQLSDLVKAFTLIESVRYILDLWWNIYVSFWTLVVQMFYREWILMFHHSEKWVYLYHLWLNFYCTSLCELHELWLLFYVLWIFHFLYYMQYIKVMSICNIANDISFTKKCSYLMKPPFCLWWYITVHIR